MGLPVGLVDRTPGLQQAARPGCEAGPNRPSWKTRNGTRNGTQFRAAGRAFDAWPVPTTRYRCCFSHRMGMGCGAAAKNEL
ncbi:unnamed protein product [Gadus morhua 'NCC']